MKNFIEIHDSEHNSPISINISAIAAVVKGDENWQYNEHTYIVTSQGQYYETKESYEEIMYEIELAERPYFIGKRSESDVIGDCIYKYNSVDWEKVFKGMEVNDFPSGIQPVCDNNDYEIKGVTK